MPGIRLSAMRRARWSGTTGDMDAARSNGLTASGDDSQLASLFSVLQPGDRGFNIVEP